MKEPFYLDTYAYYRIATYALIGIFGTGSLLTSGICFAVVLVAELFTRLLFAMIRMKDQRIRLMVATIGVLLPGVGVAILLELYGSAIRITETTFLPFPSIFLVAVPLLTVQDELPSIGKRTHLSIGLSSFAILLGIGAIREYLGFGMILGNRFIAGDRVPMPILSHASGAAFLVLLSMILAVYAWRFFLRRKVLLAVDPARKIVPMDMEEPIFAEVARTTLVFFAFLLLDSALLYVVWLSGYITGFYGYLLISFLISSLFLLLSMAFTKFGEQIRQTILAMPYLFLLLIAVPSLPFSAGYLLEGTSQGMIREVFAYVLFLAMASLAVMFFTLFRRALRTKLLFGNRPEILSGIPFVLLVLAPSLLVLSGFGELLTASLLLIGG